MTACIAACSVEATQPQLLHTTRTNSYANAPQRKKNSSSGVSGMASAIDPLTYGDTAADDRLAC